VSFKKKEALLHQFKPDYSGNHQIYLPTEIQKMLKDSGTVRIQILGG
jgi:hypothetical protein